MWFQLSKAQWAQNGDKNSKFFHIWATQQKRKNLIQKIWDASRAWTSNPESIVECLIDYYQDLFSSANLQRYEETTNSINRIISEEMNSQLKADFKAWEIQQAIKQMTPLKAPRPNGMPHLFHQHN